jgi:hypothetical protein
MKTAVLALVLFCFLFVPVSQADEWCTNMDVVYADVNGSSVTVKHDGASFNCGTDGVNYQVDIDTETGIIDIVETTTLEVPALCYCCFEFGVTIDDLANGDYTANYTWYDEEPDEWVTVPIYFTIAVRDEPDTPVVGFLPFSGCLPGYELQSAPDPKPPHDTWGRLKKMFE